MKKTVKKILMLTAVIVMTVICFAFSASALEKEGQCGKNVYWKYDAGTETIVISGKGEMYDFDEALMEGGSPFKNTGIETVIIKEGVTNIAYNAFYECYYVKTVVIPVSVTYIGESVFDFHDKSCVINYAGTEKQWNKIDIVDSNSNEYFFNGKINFNAKVPGKTSSLKATPAQKTVNLTWSKVNGATGYRVYQYDFKKASSDKLADTTSASYTVKNLKPGTKYRFSVKAYKKIGDYTLWSDQYTIVLTSTLPGKATSLKATPSQKSVKLTWAAVSGATGYNLYQYNYDKKCYETIATITGTSYTVKNLKPATKCKFAVKAYIVSEGKTYRCDEYASVLLGTLPGKTTSLKAAPTDSTVKLSWKAVAGASGYRVYQYDYNKKASDKLKDTSATSYTVKKLKSSTKYRFSVKAYKTVDGVKYWSDVYTIVETNTALGKPSALKATSTKNSIKLTWDAVKDATGYKVYRYDFKKGKSVELTTVTSRCYTVNSLVSGTKYRFSVKAYKTVNGKKKWSDVYTSITTATLPGKTQSIKAVPTHNTIKLSWKGVSGATGYLLYLYDSNNKKYKELVSMKETACTVKKLEGGTTYKFAVKAYKTVDKKEYRSDVYTTVVCATLVGKTSSLKVTPAQSSVKLSWKAVSGATGYAVYQYNYSKGTSEKIAVVSGTEYTVKNLKSATQYKFLLKTYKKVDGKTYWSDSAASVVTSTLPANVPSLKATSTKNSVTLTWGAVSGATGYRVYIYDGYGEYETLVTTKNKKYTVSYLDSKTKYKFAVKAYKQVDGKNYWSKSYSSVGISTKSDPDKLIAYDFACEPATCYVSSEVGLILRKGPGTSYAKIYTIAYGQMLDVLGGSYSTDDWIYVSDGSGSEGWVCVDYVTETDPYYYSYLVYPDFDYNPVTYYVSSDAGLVLRKGPGTGYDKIKTIAYKQAVTILGGSYSSDYWVYVCYNGTYGWVSAGYLTDTKPNSSYNPGHYIDEYYYVDTWSARVKPSSGLNIRSGATSGSYSYGVLKRNTTVYVIGVSAYDSDWYYVEAYQDGRTFRGFVNGEYIY